MGVTETTQVLSRADRRAVIIPARKMGAQFFMRTIVGEKNKYKRDKQGWAWYFYGVPIDGNPPKHWTMHDRQKSSTVTFNTKYEAAQDFLKWALVNL